MYSIHCMYFSVFAHCMLHGTVRLHIFCMHSAHYFLFCLLCIFLCFCFLAQYHFIYSVLRISVSVLYSLHMNAALYHISFPYTNGETYKSFILTSIKYSLQVSSYFCSSLDNFWLQLQTIRP